MSTGLIASVLFRAAGPRLGRCARLGLVGIGVSAICACSSPAPAPPSATPPAAAPAAAPAAPAAPSSAAVHPAPPVRLAPRDPALETWKRAAAERIHAANTKELFAGRPHHLLQAVIVVEATVDRTGKVTQSRIVRSPGIKALDQVALSSLKAASPLPAPPTALVARGTLVYSETWLFQNDGRFQVRTLAMAQE